MLRDRTLVALVLLPIGLYLVWLGGWVYLLVMGVFLGIASWEYAQLFKAGGFNPAGFLILAGVAALVIGRFLNADRGDPFQWDSPILALFTLLAMTVHLFDFERGDRFSGTDFVITLGGIVYFGHLGGYLIPLRFIPEGFWWFLTVLPAVWLGDSGAYFIGRRFGRRQLSPRLSPKKTWEGYFGGVLVGTVGTALWVLGLRALSPEISITWVDGSVLGLILSVVTPLGDLGQSMIKRQVGIKDSGKILPGHGGMFDRIDTWIWAAAIGYFIITIFLI